MLTLCSKCLTMHTKNITFFSKLFLRKCSKIVKRSSDTFSNISDLEHFGSRKSSEITGTLIFGNPSHNKTKSHVRLKKDEKEKVGRYTTLPFLAIFSGKFTPMCARLASTVSFCNTAL